MTGHLRRFEDLPPGDFRRTNPRFQGANFAKNLELVAQVEALAKGKGCIPSQLALAWLLARAPFIVPIPGTKRRRYLEENAGAVRASVTAEEMARLDAVFPKGAAAGDRYAEVGMKLVNV